MKKVTRLIAVLSVLLSFTGIAAAAGPELGPFSTTGYTTFGEFEVLPNNYMKMHITAQGEPGDANDLFCEAVYGAPCQDVCAGFTGKGCGTDGFFQDGSFAFEEWGLGDYSTSTGFNYGRLTVTTGAGEATLRFGGSANGSGVTGGYAFLDGSGEYARPKGEGVYNGGAEYVFTVDYTPCGGKDQAACLPDRCAVYGDDLGIKKDKLEWKILNLGEKDLTTSKVTLVWPEANGPITKVKLGGKTLYEGSLGQPSVVPELSGLWATIDLSSWQGKEKEIQLGRGKKGELLEVEFKPGKGLDISANPWDYTILVEFGGGCAVPFVAFAPAPAVPVN